MRTHSRVVIAHHLIFTGYGHWLPNDPRGSGSEGVAKPALRELGPVHHGRKAVQPPREELKDFYRRAVPRLDHAPIWFDDAKRQAVAGALGGAAKRNQYTVCACAVCSNHAHLLIRRHRDDGRTIWVNCADAARDALLAWPGVVSDHPVWAERPYDVFVYTPEEVWDRIDYVNKNPLKEGLPAQHWDFVKSYDNWPFRRR